MADNFQTSKVTTNEQSSATKFNNFVQAVEDAINSLDNSNIDAAAAIAVSKLAAGSNTQVLTTTAGVPVWAAPGGATVVPTGAVTQFAAAAAPTGWVLCDGTSYLRSGGPVDALYAVIGTSYGSVDGTHFNVPDFRGRVPAGYAASGGHSDVATLGNADSVAVGNRRPKHKHTVTDPGHTHSITDIGTGVQVQTKFQSGGSPGSNSSATQSATTGISVGTSTDQADAPAYLVINYIIKT